MQGRLIGIGCLALALLSTPRCGDSSDPVSVDTSPELDASTAECRPVDAVLLAGSPIRLPCEKTVEACDGIDNDADGIVDPHCATPCSSDSACTYQGLLIDAACNAGVCGSIHTVPSDGAHALCAGVLCPPNMQCVEGDCVSGGQVVPGGLCTSGSLCPVGAGCVLSAAAESGGAMGQCVLPCPYGECPAGYLCIAPSSEASSVCSQRYFCEGSVDECAAGFAACETDSACASILQCLTSSINALKDTNPYEPSVVLLGMVDSPLSACWDEASDNDAVQSLRDCLEATCEACLDCTDKVCGDDGCGGSCGICAEGTVCTDYLSSDQVGTLAPGQCVCLPECLDRDCGDDGCGGSCGTCEDDNTICSEDGKCTCWPSCEGRVCGVDGCGVACGFCDDGETCTDDGQCLCVPDCEGKTCGHDGCAGTCGTCDDPDMVCDDGVGQCVCFPTCDGKSCGFDGCGNSCGECPVGTGCGPEGQCGCFPTCDGKTCGTDGCGVSCGVCPAGEQCNSAGTCECMPNCSNKDCGDDGCGGTCGTCAAGENCAAGICLSSSADSCAGLCAEPKTMGCKCDVSCFMLGDCCPDICEACATEFSGQCSGT